MRRVRARFIPEAAPGRIKLGGGAQHHLQGAQKADLCENANAMSEAAKAETIYFWQAPFADFRHVEDQPAVLRALRRATALREVEVLLRRPPSLRDQVRPEPVRPAAFADGYRLAHRVRNLLGNETGRIEDPRQVLEEIFGVLVVAEPLASAQLRVRITSRPGASSAIS